MIIRGLISAYQRFYLVSVFAFNDKQNGSLFRVLSIGRNRCGEM